MSQKIAPSSALRSCFAGLAVLALSVVALPMTLRATPITSWTASTGTGATGLSTNSPVFGNGAANSGNGYQINAALPSAYSLNTVGDALTFSGAAVFNLTSAGAASDQFRIGIFDTAGSTTTNGWLGYFGTNSGSGGNPNGRLWERKSGNNSAYFNNADTSTFERRASAGTPASTASTSTFLSGTYTFSINVTLVETGLSVSWSIVGTGSTNYSISGTYIDTNPATHTFDRVGIMTGGGLNANQVSFSNLDVTYASAIPEPASWAVIVAGFALAAACLRRRARA